MSLRRSFLGIRNYVDQTKPVGGSILKLVMSSLESTDNLVSSSR